MIVKDHHYWMQKAISQAEIGETAYGAVIVNENDQFIEAFNTVKQDGSTAHAEINVIQRLKELEVTDALKLKLYTTVEPCPMCMGAIIWAGIGLVAYGASIEDAALYGNQINITAQEMIKQSWYSIHLIPEVAREQCVSLLQKY